MLNSALKLLQYMNRETFKKVGISPEYDKIVCPGCKNSKVVIQKDNLTYEYSYDENGKQTIEVKYRK